MKLKYTMVLIFYGNSENCEQVCCEACYLNCLRHSTRLRAVTNLIFCNPKRLIFFHLCATCSELPSDISTMVGGRFATSRKSSDTMKEF